jgi:mannose/cellobiose epimerase-like protein (N-acyl-D-glucosamine 2-epimerase family)
MSNSIESQIAAKRAALEETLDAIEDKFNVSKQVSEVTERAKKSYGANPVPWIVGATAVAIAVAGLVAWAVLSDD